MESTICHMKKKADHVVIIYDHKYFCKSKKQDAICSDIGVSIR